MDDSEGTGSGDQRVDFGARLAGLAARGPSRSPSSPAVSASPPPPRQQVWGPPPRVPVWVFGVAMVCMVGCGASVQVAVAAVTGAVRGSQAASTQHVPRGFTSVGTLAGTTLWLRRDASALDLRSTGSVTVSCASPPVLGNPRYRDWSLCIEPARSGTVVAYAVDDAFHGARFRLSDGKLLDATVLDISSVVARYRLMVAVLPGVHAEPGDVTYR